MYQVMSRPYTVKKIFLKIASSFGTVGAFLESQIPEIEMLCRQYLCPEFSLAISVVVEEF